MKRSCFIILVILIAGIQGCDVLDLSFKKISYTVDAQEQFSYVTFLLPGEMNESYETISRSTFDIPNSASIDRFLVKNIYIDVMGLNNNECAEMNIAYGIDVEGNQFTSNFSLPVPDNQVESFLLNNNFTATFPEVRLAIEDAVVNGTTLEISFLSSCKFVATLNASIVITLDIVAEYTDCEELPSDFDLPEC